MEPIDGIEAKALALHILDPKRSKPIVVVSRGKRKAFIDTERLREDLRGYVDVVEVTKDGSWELDRMLPKGTTTYGGASRLYPVNWDKSHDTAPIVLCWSEGEAARATAKITNLALSSSQSGGIRLSAAEKESPIVIGKVEGIMDDAHILMRMENGQQAICLSGRIRGDVLASDLVEIGQPLRGRIRGDGYIASFIPVREQSTKERFIQEMSDSLVRVLVESVDLEKRIAVVKPHPDLPLTWKEEDGDLDLIGAGDVIAVAVTKDLQASQVHDPEEGELFALIPMGPAWPSLFPERVVDETYMLQAAESDDEQDVPTEGEATAADLAEATWRIDSLIEENEDLKEQLRTTRTELTEVRNLLRAARSSRVPVVYDHPEQQFRYEVEQEWLIRFSESERRERRLAPFSLGSDFLESMKKIQGIKRDKVVAVVVEVLTGLAPEIPGRHVHQWLVSKTGAPEVRDDGSMAWRVALQQKTASARRLKYWQKPDGSIELDSIRLHDDGISK